MIASASRPLLEWTVIASKSLLRMLVSTSLYIHWLILLFDALAPNSVLSTWIGGLLVLEMAKHIFLPHLPMLLYSFLWLVYTAWIMPKELHHLKKVVFSGVCSKDPPSLSILNGWSNFPWHARAGLPFSPLAAMIWLQKSTMPPALLVCLQIYCSASDSLDQTVRKVLVLSQRIYWSFANHHQRHWLGSLELTFRIEQKASNKSGDLEIIDKADFDLFDDVVVPLIPT